MSGAAPASRMGRPAGERHGTSEPSGRITRSRRAAGERVAAAVGAADRADAPPIDDPLVDQAPGQLLGVADLVARVVEADEALRAALRIQRPVVRPPARALEPARGVGEDGVPARRPRTQVLELALLAAPAVQEHDERQVALGPGGQGDVDVQRDPVPRLDPPVEARGGIQPSLAELDAVPRDAVEPVERPHGRAGHAGRAERGHAEHGHGHGRGRGRAGQPAGDLPPWPRHKRAVLAGRCHECAKTRRRRGADPLGSGLVASAKIVLLPGDGIGPEILDAAVAVLRALGDFEFEERPFGGASIDADGTALTNDTLAACRAADAVLLAAVGGPRWDSTDPAAPRPEQGLLGLRKGLGLFANLRPVRPVPALYDASPLRRERIEGTDLLVVRELTGGIYFGDKGRAGGRAHDVCEYTEAEIERIARIGFGAARSRVTSVDKANVLETSRLWREVVRRVHSQEFPNVELEHVLVDNAAMQLVAAPRHFDVILTENMFGDILSDEAAMLTGSIGMLPSASLGEPDAPGVFEPVHGSAPDIAGEGIANPLAMILSAAMMLRHGLAREDAAAAVESAVDRALDGGLRTTDLGGNATTAEATEAVLEELT